MTSLDKNTNNLDKGSVTTPVKVSDQLAQILAMAEQQSKKHKAELIDKKILLAEHDICEALGISLQELEKAVDENRMFYLSHDRLRYYPAFYSDRRVSILMLESVTQALGDLTGSQKWQFFARPKNSLSGKTPVDALQEGLLDKVLIAAKGFVER